MMQLNTEKADMFKIIGLFNALYITLDSQNQKFYNYADKSLDARAFTFILHSNVVLIILDDV